MMSYEDFSPASRAAHMKGMQKKAASDDAQGPPDKRQDFTKGFLVNVLHVPLDLHYMCIHNLHSICHICTCICIPLEINIFFCHTGKKLSCDP